MPEMLNAYLSMPNSYVTSSIVTKCLPVTWRNSLGITSIALCNHQTVVYGLTLADTAHLRCNVSPSVTSVSVGRSTITGRATGKQYSNSKITKRYQQNKFISDGPTPRENSTILWRRHRQI